MELKLLYLSIYVYITTCYYKVCAHERSLEGLQFFKILVKMDRFVIVTSCCSNKYLYHMKYDDGDENNLHLRECSSAEQATRARERVVIKWKWVRLWPQRWVITTLLIHYIYFDSLWTRWLVLSLLEWTEIKNFDQVDGIRSTCNMSSENFT